MPVPPEVTARLHVVILAAGASNRFGNPKQLAEFRGQSLIGRATDAARHLADGDVTIVLGAHSRLVESALSGEDAQMVLNADWRDGLASSVRKGLLSVPPSAMAVLLLPCDMPLVDKQFLSGLADQWGNDRSKIITCESERGAGLPAIVPRRYFKPLMSIKGDPGINSFFARHRPMSVEIVAQQVQSDIDTIQDLERLNSISD